MENIFLTKLDIKSVRHLHGIEIPLSDMVRKHLILTGKNGSGKTSTLESLKEHLEFIISNQYESYEKRKKITISGRKSEIIPLRMKWGDTKKKDMKKIWICTPENFSIGKVEQFLHAVLTVH